MTDKTRLMGFSLGLNATGIHFRQDLPRVVILDAS